MGRRAEAHQVAVRVRGAAVEVFGITSGPAAARDTVTAMAVVMAVMVDTVRRVVRPVVRRHAVARPAGRVAAAVAVEVEGTRPQTSQAVGKACSQGKLFVFIDTIDKFR